MCLLPNMAMYAHDASQCGFNWAARYSWLGTSSTAIVLSWAARPSRSLQTKMDVGARFTMSKISGDMVLILGP
jgi:hypothetical protein